MIPLRFYILAGMLAAAFVMGGYSHFKWAEAASLKAHIAAEATARQQERDDANRTIHSLDNFAADQAKTAAAALSARSVVDGLRQRLASLPANCPAATASSANEQDGAIRDLFGTCAALLAEGSEHVDVLRARAKALETR